MTAFFCKFSKILLFRLEHPSAGRRREHLRPNLRNRWVNDCPLRSGWCHHEERKTQSRYWSCLVQKYLGGEARARMACRLGITETQVTSLVVVLIMLPTPWIRKALKHFKFHTANILARRLKPGSRIDEPNGGKASKDVGQKLHFNYSSKATRSWVEAKGAGKQQQDGFERGQGQGWAIRLAMLDKSLATPEQCFEWMVGKNSMLRWALAISRGVDQPYFWPQRWERRRGAGHGFGCWNNINSIEFKIDWELLILWDIWRQNFDLATGMWERCLSKGEEEEEARHECWNDINSIEVVESTVDVKID